MQFTTNVQRWISNFKSWDLNFRYHSKRSGNRIIFTLKFTQSNPDQVELLIHRVKHNTFLYIARGNIRLMDHIQIQCKNGLQENLELGEYKFIIDFPEKLCEKL